MSPDQIKRFADVYERLVESAIEEADPENWAGAGKRTAQMDKTERGDRVWDKKSAALSLQLVANARMLMQGGEPQDDDERERMVDDAQKEAAKIIDRIEKSLSHREKQRTAPK